MQQKLFKLLVSVYEKTGSLAEPILKANQIMIRPLKEDIGHYVKALLELSKKRKLSNILKDVSRLSATNANTDDVISKLYFNLEELDKQQDTVIDISQAILEPPSVFIETGFPMIDTFSPIERKNLVIVGGRPSTGKSMLARQIELNLIHQDKTVIHFSLEEGAGMCFRKVLSNLTQIELNTIKRGKFSKTEVEIVTKAYEFLKKKKMFIVEDFGATVNSIRSACKRITMTKGQIDLIVVDYIQLIRHPLDGTRDAQVAAISASLKRIAGMFNAPVLCLSQLNRAEALERAFGSPPNIATLRDSGSLEQDADIVMLLDEEPFDFLNTTKPRKMNIWVRKSRNGEPCLQKTTTFRQYQKITSDSL